jgi:hypothetical protein
MGFLIFIKGLWANPLVRQVIIYAAIAAVAGIALWQWGNRQWMKGEIQGETQATKQIEKVKAAEWKTHEASIAVKQAQVELGLQSLQEARKQFETDKAQISDMRRRDDVARTEALNEIRRTREADRANANRIPAGELIGAIRDLSAKLAAEPSPVQ